MFILKVTALFYLYIPSNIFFFIFLWLYLVITDNLVEDLLGDFEYQLQVPYIMYRNSAQEVIGIWFYNSQECQEVANLFSRYLVNLLLFHLPLPLGSSSPLFMDISYSISWFGISRGSLINMLRFSIFLIRALFIEYCMYGVN